MIGMSRYSEWVSGKANRNRHMFEASRSSKQFEKILFVDFPARNMKRGIRVFFEDLLRARFGKTVQRGLLWRLAEIDSGVYVLTTVEHVFVRKQLVQRIRTCMAHLAITNPVLWSYAPTVPECLTNIPSSVTIFDAVDDWTKHPSYASVREQLQRNYDVIRRTVNVIITVSRQLMSRFPGRQNVFWVPNGVDVGRFRLRQQRDGRPPVVVYVGILQERFDVALVRELALARPQYEFRLIGWVWKSLDISPLKRLANVRVLGFLPYDEIPKQLAESNVGIIPHTRDGLAQSMNPLKLYEYLAAGVPVVTTEQPDFQRFVGVREAATAEEFAAAIDAFLRQPPDAATLRAHVEPFSWRNRFQSVMHHAGLAESA